MCIPKSQFVIVLHYTNWCSFCKAMRPHWENVKQRCKGKNIQFKEIDEDVAKTPGINGFPTIVAYHGNRREVYGGWADSRALYWWIIAQTQA